MVIAKRKIVGPAVTSMNAEAFIGGAPDGSAAKAKKPGRTVITMSLAPDLLARADAWASAHGMTRSATVALALSQLVAD
jgi:hypothetical protein